MEQERAGHVVVVELEQVQGQAEQGQEQVEWVQEQAGHVGQGDWAEARRVAGGKRVQVEQAEEAKQDGVPEEVQPESES